MTKEWIYLTITIITGSTLGIVLALLREIIGHF
ncbi:hypothetical protein LCGC14_1619920 [marine sediment metagenome]|uniref:Uncharacterized protein n=1 Tax=marine sediment metagenome TaxID=412755 RepID=A0A0F9I5Y8_9ZZZZ